MSLKQELKKQKITAFKNKEKEKVETLNLVLASIQNKEIKHRVSELSDEDTQKVISSELKQTNESLEFAVKSNKSEEIEKLNRRVEFLTSFLPKQMSEDEIREFVKAVLEQEGITSKKEMGKAMKAVMPKLNGKADGTLINKVVNSLLS